MVYLCIYQLIPYDRTSALFPIFRLWAKQRDKIMKASSDCFKNLIAADETGMQVHVKRELVHTVSGESLTFYAHLLREPEGITDNGNQKWSGMMQDLLNEILDGVRDTFKAATTLES
jgi:hypothetical protein